jgi:hypothetical protein
MIRITKGDIVLECETQADLQLALSVLCEPVDVPALPSMHVPVEVNAPAWRVGGPTEPYVPELPNDEPSGNMRVNMGFDTAQHISVPSKQLDVLEAVKLFPEGVSCKAVGELLGLSDKQVGGRIQQLRRANLIEHVPHHNLWVATPLARRAKLVRA